MAEQIPSRWGQQTPSAKAADQRPHTHGWVFLWALIAALGFPSVCWAQTQAQQEIYTIKAVAVTVRAPSLAEARRQAENLAQKIAFDRLHARMVAAPERAQVTLSEQEISNLVAAFSIADEQIGRDQYQARITVRFRSDAVRRTLAAAGVQFTDLRAVPIVIVPLYSAAHQPWRLWKKPNPWYDAWQAQQRRNDIGLVPLFIPQGTLEDLRRLDPQRAESLTAENLRAFARRLSCRAAVLARAQASGDPQTGTARLELSAQLYAQKESPQGAAPQGAAPQGAAPVGAFSYEVLAPQILVQQPGESPEDLWRRATRFISTRLEDLWKEEVAFRPRAAQRLLLSVALDGELTHWRDIQQRIESIGGIEAMTLKRLSVTRALLEISFSGEFAFLSRALQLQDLGIKPLAPLSGLPHWQLTPKASKSQFRPPAQSSFVRGVWR